MFMPRDVSPRATVIALLLLVPAGFAVGAGASHDDPQGVNYTHIPYSSSAGGADNSHRPGIDDASYMSLSVDTDNPPDTGFRRIDFVVVRSDDIDFSDCQPQDTEAFGIDRDNDDPGTTTDTSLLDNYESVAFNEDSIVLDFYEEEDIAGDSEYINASDQLVSAQVGCYTNPDEPGWYRFRSAMNGTRWNGEHDALTPNSHYFYVCDCSSEQEARETLGPPPSEQVDESTATVTSTAARTATPDETATRSTESEETESGVTEKATVTRTTAVETSRNDGTPIRDATGSATATRTTTAASTERSGRPATVRTSSDVPTTPTLAGGAGFGAVASLAALLFAALFALRRR